jgi:hypothetical protein
MNVHTYFPKLKKSITAVALTGALVTPIGLQPVYAASVAFPVTVSPTISVDDWGGNIRVDGHGFTPGGTVRVMYFRDDSLVPVVHDVTAMSCGSLIYCLPGRITDQLFERYGCVLFHTYKVYAKDMSTQKVSNTIPNAVTGCPDTG